MTYAQTLAPPASASTDLERLGPAHERGLRAPIASLARALPHLMGHLRERCVEPIGAARHGHDHRERDRSEDFIRAAGLFGDLRAPETEDPDMIDKQPGAPGRGGERALATDRAGPPDRVQVRQRSGIWEVKVDGKFHGDYHRKEHALAAAARVRLSTR